MQSRRAKQIKNVDFKLISRGLNGSPKVNALEKRGNVY